MSYSFQHSTDTGLKRVLKKLLNFLCCFRRYPAGIVATAAFVSQQPWPLSPAVHEVDLQVNTGSGSWQHAHPDVHIP